MDIKVMLNCWHADEIKSVEASIAELRRKQKDLKDGSVKCLLFLTELQVLYAV